MKALSAALALALSLGLASLAQEPAKPAALKRAGLEKGLYVVMGRVVSGTLIANFGLNLGDIVSVAEDGKTMLVLKSGRKFPLSSEEPNLLKAEERMAQLATEANKDSAELARLNETLVKDELETKEILTKLDALIASVPQSSTLVFDRSSGVYAVNSNAGMSFEQQKLFNELNSRLGALRKEIKQTQKRIPDAEAELEKDRKAIAKLEADLSQYRKESAAAPQGQAANDGKALRERLAKLKALYGEGLLTKEQYDREAHEAVAADAKRD